MTTDSTSVLSGIRILDIGTMIAGPFSATLLADFGAEVIKVERPDGGDTLRKLGPFVDGESLYWAVDGRNKKSVTIDFHKERGKTLFKELVKISDVVVENFRPGTLDKWGLGYKSLQDIKPDIIMCSVSGYGQTGPYAQKASYDRIALAFAGYTHITGYPDLPPLRPGVAIADYVGGLYAAFSILLALQHRNNTQQGLHVDVALYEALYRLTEVLTVSYDKLGQERTRMGNLHFAAAPGGHFLTKDGDYVVLTVSGGDGVFRRFTEAIGQPELSSDPRFDTHQHRWENINQTNKLVEEWMSKLSTQEVLAALDKFGIPASKVYSIKDMMADPHYQARESYQSVEHPRLGPLKMQAPTPKLSEAQGRIINSGPQLGENNQEIFQGLLGLSREETDQLSALGII